MKPVRRAKRASSGCLKECRTRPRQTGKLTDAQGRPLAMGDDDLDLFHAGHYRGMTADVATGLAVTLN